MTPQEYICAFADGPAMDQRIHTVVPPTDVRWFLQMEVPGRVESWWVFHAEPEPDPALRITRYEKCGEEPGGFAHQTIVNYKEAKAK